MKINNRGYLIKRGGQLTFTVLYAKGNNRKKKGRISMGKKQIYVESGLIGNKVRLKVEVVNEKHEDNR